MSKSLLLMLCIVIGLVVLACTKYETNRNAAAPAAATSPVPAGTPRTNANTAPATAEKVGVAECDAFITAYESCVSSKVPEAQRGPLRAAVNTWRTEWKRMADNPQTRAGLVAACKRQMESARTQLKAYNCTF
jgi:hypothetical protein